MSYPRLMIDHTKLLENMNLMADLCHSRGISLAVTSKCLSSHPACMQAINLCRADMVADARLANLARMETDKPRMLLRIPMLSELEDVPCGCEISLHSEIKTIRLLAQAAAGQKRRHQVMLMTDLGDLREGILYNDRDGLCRAAEAVLASPWLDLCGLGVNYSCFSGVLPDSRNLGWLRDLAQLLRDKYGVALPLVSGGATSTLDCLVHEQLPAGITNLRVGEAILTAYDSSGNQSLKALPHLGGLHNDAFILEAEVVERKLKPSLPIGRVSCNAFGEAPVFEDKGEMLRGVCACGRLDIDHASMFPLDAKVEVLGGSSDHTIVDMTRSPGYGVGDIVRFRLGYASLMRAFLSPHVEKVTVR